MTEELEQLLKNLKLRRILEIYDEQLRAADKDDISYSDFREVRRLEQFDFKFPTSIDEKKVRELANLRFLERHENVLLLGPPGVGKTHLAVSLGMEAIRHGFGVYFVSLPNLLERLGQAPAENRLRRKMSHLRKCRLLILDEIGYQTLDRQATTGLFQLISERYERASVILTSNKSYGEWGAIFRDNVIASAILDRLLHHSHTINIKGESYRLKDKRKAGVWTAATAESAGAGGAA